ncbi:13406_t:CDS:1 [Ambispora gerdemannii]|uniref:13406_t:CDS:1 n=1 Tax=Ambispora gerdemannii TaxID=144530 RepID=A0A9N8VXV3_9GLOM|nr:13406_t:CDS:1 [Ambispora gerdemannii]
MSMFRLFSEVIANLLFFRACMDRSSANAQMAVHPPSSPSYDKDYHTTNLKFCLAQQRFHSMLENNKMKDTISSGDNTPNCTYFTRRSGAEEYANKYPFMMGNYELN